MSITSFSFVLFVLITAIIYYSIHKKYQWVILLISSYIFYSFFGCKYIPFLLITTFSTYISSKRIYKEQLLCKLRLEKAETIHKREIKNLSKKKSKRYLIFTIILNFGILVFFKYYDITKEGLYILTGNDSFNVTQHLLLPLGISFYMFQSIGYLIDVYWGKYKAEDNVFKFALFVSFFPQIIQGPISRYSDLAPQLFGEHKLNEDNISDGIQNILLGLFKKLIIADRLSVLVTTVMTDHWKYSGSIIFVTILIYGIQIYCDFSGGIDVISGVAKIFSIHLTPNFKRPLFATSVRDFWRRWHITLGRWMRDYVFYPLSLSKWIGKLNRNSRKVLGPRLGKTITISISSLIVYILVGLWHGPSLKYIVFGLWHGIIISVALGTEDTVKNVKGRLRIKDNSLLWHLLQIVVTTLLVTFGRYFSRASSLLQALSMFKRTLLNFNIGSLFNGVFLDLGLTNIDLIIVVISVLVLIIYEIILECEISIKNKLENSPAIFQYAFLFIFLCILTYYGFYAKGDIPSEFIYMKY